MIHLVAGTLVTLLLLRVAALWSADRYLRYGLAAMAVTAFIASRLAGHDDFVAGYWGLGFTLGVVAHDSLPRRRPS